MRVARFVALAFVPVFGCFSGGGGAPGDAGVDAGSADVVVPVDAGGDEEATTSPACEGGPADAGAPGTMHGGSVSQPETWTQAGSPYRLPYDTEITAPLTLEACTTVLIGAQKTLTVTGAGSIVAKGTQLAPVYVMRKDAANWASIRAVSGGTLSFEWTQIHDGGDPLNTIPYLAAMLDVRADQTKPPAGILRAVHLSLAGSSSQGIYLHEGGAFTADSTGIIVEGSSGYPIHASANLAGTIPSDSSNNYALVNGTNEILISGGDAYQTIASWDVTFHDLGVPYHIGGTTETGLLEVGGQPGAKATLTIDPGVTLRFKKGGALHVDASQGTNAATGALIAVGTPAKPIVFTSGESPQVAGDWLGLDFGEMPSSSDELEYVTIAYAGGATTSGSSSCPYPGTTINDAALRIYGAPTSAFLTHGSITDSASNGIDRGWASDSQPDFLADGTNVFARIAQCTQTFPKNAQNGGCPNPVPCPK
jgi:hypothetical protein